MSYYYLTLRRLLFWLLLLLLLVIFGVVYAQSNVDNLSNNQESGIVDSIVAPPLFIQKNAKQLAKIQKCESGGIHYTASGEVLQSRTSDFGRWQINKKWIPIAESLGYDIMTPEGNEQMMFHILTVQGLNAWVCYRK